MNEELLAGGGNEALNRGYDPTQDLWVAKKSPVTASSMVFFSPSNGGFFHRATVAFFAEQWWLFLSQNTVRHSIMVYRKVSPIFMV